MGKLSKKKLGQGQLPPKADPAVSVQGNRHTWKGDEDISGLEHNATGPAVCKGFTLNSFTGSPHKVFLVIGLIFGITFLCVTPPFLAADEWSHFNRSYFTSEGNLKAKKFPERGANAIGGMLPEGVKIAESLAQLNLPPSEANIRQLPQLDKYNGDQYLAGRKFNAGPILSLFSLSAAQSVPFFSERLFIFFPNANYLPHLFMPQAAGIALGRLLGLPVIALMYMGRFFNLIVWLGLIYFAIKNTPVLKWLFLLYALTPTSLSQSSSLSADALTNGLSILLIAVFLRYAYDENEGKAKLAVIFPLALLVSVSKLYFPLVMLYLLVPEKKVGGRKRYWIMFLLLAVLTAVSVLLWRYYAKDIYVPLKPGISPGEQLQYILQGPVNYISVLWNSVRQDGLYYVITFVGKFGHYEHILPSWLIAIHSIMLFIVASIDGNERVFISYKDKLLLFAAFLSGSLWVFTSQYLSWTEVGAAAVVGINGRYFIPVMLPFFALLYNRRFDLGGNKNRIYLAMTCYVVFLLTFSSYVIIDGYYY